VSVGAPSVGDISSKLTTTDSRLWGVENSGDDFNRTVDGVSADIHHENPAEELNYFGDIAEPNDQWYGYPTCYTVGNPALFPDTNDLQVGDQFVLAPNETFNDATCVERSVGPVLPFPAHAAPMDIKFDQESLNAYVPLHGSWNRQPSYGYKVVEVPFTKNGDGGFVPVAARNTLTGFQEILSSVNETSCSMFNCFRPVGIAVTPQNKLYVVSDSFIEGEMFLLEKV
jgi:glucose/arabinose dehydrogenase